MHFHSVYTISRLQPCSLDNSMLPGA